MTVGEIKSAKGRQDAVEQVVKRLVVIGSATKKIATTVPLILHGDVYTRRSEWLNDSEDLQDSVAKIMAKMELSPLAEGLHISVDMVKI